MGKRKARETEESTTTMTEPQSEGGETSAANNGAFEPYDTKKEAVRTILEQEGYDLSPAEIAERVEARFGIKGMSYNAAASHKSSITKGMDGGKKRTGKKRGRKPRVKTADAAVESAPRPSPSEKHIEDIKTLKQLIRRHGVPWIHDILDLLS